MFAERMRAIDCVIEKAWARKNPGVTYPQRFSCRTTKEKPEGDRLTHPDSPKKWLLK